MNNKIELSLEHYQYLVMLVFVIITNSLCTYSTNPFFHCSNLDSNIFQLLGDAVLDGKIPYVDVFDHKGPFIYFMNALGLSIDRSWGLFFLLNVNLFAVSIIWYKTCLLFNNSRWMALWCTVVGILLTHLYGASDNMSEFWALPYCSLVLYICIKHINDKSYRLSYKEELVIGGCVALAVMIRANTIISSLAYPLVLWLCHIKKKEWKNAFHLVIYAFLGFACTLLPFILWFYAKGGNEAVNELFFGTFMYNLEYAKNYDPIQASLLVFLRQFVRPFLFVVPLIFVAKKCKEHVLPIALACVFTILTTGKACYVHYLASFIPIIIIAISLFFKLPKNHRPIAFILPLIVLASYYKVIKGDFIGHYTSGDFTRYEERNNSFMRIVENNIFESERDSVWASDLDGAFDMLNAARIVPCNKVLLSFQLNISERLRNTTNYLETARPKWIVIRQKEVMGDFIRQNYEMVDSTKVPGIVNVKLLKRL